MYEKPLTDKSKITEKFNTILRRASQSSQKQKQIDLLYQPQLKMISRKIEKLDQEIILPSYQPINTLSRSSKILPKDSGSSMSKEIAGNRMQIGNGGCESRINLGSSIR